MNIYFSCSITGGRNEEKVYQQIVRALQDWGHEVPTAILSSSEVMELEKVVDPRETYERDMRWLNQADAVVAEVSTPSHGVGYEIALANFYNKPVLCCYRKDRKVSKMILGNPSPLQQVCTYQYPGELKKVVSSFLDALQNGRKA